MGIYRLMAKETHQAAAATAARQPLKRQVALVCQICVVKCVQLQFAHSHAVFCGGHGRAKDMMPLVYMNAFRPYIALDVYTYACKTTYMCVFM